MLHCQQQPGCNFKMDAFVLDLILSRCARTKLRTESEGDWEVIVSSWLLFGNRLSHMHTEICQSGIEQWLTHTLEMQTAVLHHQNGISIIKLLKIAKLMKILVRKMKKKSRSFAWVSEKSNKVWTQKIIMFMKWFIQNFASVFFSSGQIISIP